MSPKVGDFPPKNSLKREEKMRKVIIVTLVVTAVFLLMSSPAQAVELKSYLQQYGWTIDIKQGGIFDPWDIKCSEEKQMFPKEGVNVFRNPVCTQKDRVFWTVFLWRISSIKPVAIENIVYNTMSQGLGYGKVTCTQEIVESEADPKGVAKDCTVPLQHGTFYVSFYHFSIPMPPEASFVDKDGNKQDTLGFTIWVQNAGVSNPAVKGKLRELISAIRKK